MKREADEEVYELYDSFISSFFIEKKDYFDGNDRALLTKENLKECKKRFIDNFGKDKEHNFADKSKVQFAGASEDVKRLFSHAIWLWGFSVNETKNCDLIYIENTKKPQYGFANSGQYHLTNKFGEVSFCLRLFEAIFEEILNQKKNTDKKVTVEEVKEYIVKICLCCAYRDQIEAFKSYKDTEIVSTYSTKISMINILLYLSCPNDYERIVSQSHKQKIANCFDWLVSKDEKSSYLDRRIESIRDNLGEKIHDSKFDFYDNAKIYSLWNLSASNEDDDEFSGLKFKKNIIFYGPPGTSKTYSAKKLAESFINRELLSNGVITMDDYLSDKFNVKKYIYRLQLHTNYGYENFIVGQTMINGKIEPVEGYFYDLCKKAEGDKSHPYVLILDEINRVDLARLFGEAFSCIENRNEAVDLPYKKENTFMQLSVPDNIYIIGTMNEIDFSLERLDFALRRRFLWFKHGYNSEALSDMLTEINNETDKSIFINRATELNEKISHTRELGEQYEIGHVFFAEVQNIARSCSSKRLYWAGTTPKEPVVILWKVSIRPMLEAYLDNIDIDLKKDIINDLERIYYGK